MRAVFILGGTTEGRQLAEILARRGIPATISVATGYGAALLPAAPGRTVLTGRRGAAELEALLRAGGYALAVDAAHPYAAAAHREFRAAARAAGVPAVRLIREESDLTGAVRVPSAAAAAQAVAAGAGPVLLTIGTRQLAAFAPVPRARLFARILPLAESEQACRAFGLAPGHIRRGQGPFSYEQNLADLRWCRARYLVTKDGGREGGLPQKLAAARALGVCPVVIARPAEERGLTLPQLLTRWEEWL